MPFIIRRVREEKKPSPWRRLIGPTLALIAAGTATWRRHEEHKHKEEAHKTREKHLKRTFVYLIVGLLCLLLLIGTMRALLRMKEIALGIVSVAGADLATDEHGFTNVLLLGAGDNDHAGIDLTDTIMVGSIDPEKTRSAVLLSIPRDTYVLKTENMGAGRINSLYRDYKSKLVSQGMEENEASEMSLRELADEVGRLLGLEVHGTVKVNFSGFTEAIDLLGGIDIEVPEAIVDIEYPGPNYTYETFTIGAGKQHLDGTTALKYVRTRHTTSDFSRSLRQQQVIAALGAKVKEEGIIRNAGRIGDLLAIAQKNLESTFSTRELMGLATMGQKIDTGRIVNLTLNVSNGLYGSLVEPGGFLYAPPKDQFEGASVLLPVSIPEYPVTWKQIQFFVKFVFTNRALFLHPPSIVVLNAGAIEGAARKLGGELYKFTFNVEKTRNMGPRGTPDVGASIIVVNPALRPSEGDEGAEAQWKMAMGAADLLSRTLKLPFAETADPLAFTPENADIAILLGEDYRFTYIQDLLETQK